MLTFFREKEKGETMQRFMLEWKYPADQVLHSLGTCDTTVLIDTLGFEKHMRQIRRGKGTEIPASWYERPYLYQLALPNRKVRGHGAKIEIPHRILEPDYEFEIAMYAPSRIQTSDLGEAIEYVTREAWFTIMNDMSARDVQMSDMALPLSVAPSKGFLPKIFGPRWVPARALRFDSNGVPDIPMRLSLNGLERLKDNFTSIYFSDPKDHMQKCWSFAQIIAWLGTIDQGLEVGMVLGSGTIGGGSIAEYRAPLACIPSTWPIYPWLTNGDVIRMEADFGSEGTLVLENSVLIV